MSATLLDSVTYNDIDVPKRFGNPFRKSRYRRPDRVDVGGIIDMIYIKERRSGGSDTGNDVGTLNRLH
ncbi:hypothetical protein HMPREF9057_01081 [Actinomyces sp. oral taxon 171 str. F0337]|nr:hypothetical protein HMPREF9057_01081 [Actinomyces sp. oral taxon 171 str. F0337]